MALLEYLITQKVIPKTSLQCMIINSCDSNVVGLSTAKKKKKKLVSKLC